MRADIYGLIRVLQKRLEEEFDPEVRKTLLKRIENLRKFNTRKPPKPYLGPPIITDAELEELEDDS